ncbi:hypothetical protein LSAT2_019468 [Lamellibrachia satsuma]|nr:hypothetical protein LSAT2_019468 [Lamellibrachia satsuma]
MSRLHDAAFTLSPEELQQIVILGKHHARRCQTGSKISDRMSVEAQLAMQMVVEDMRAETNDKSQQTCPALLSTDDDDADNYDVDYSSSESSLLSNTTSGNVYECQRPLATDRSRFTSLYSRGNLARARMPRDITDIAYQPDREFRRPLNRTLKLENALEIIETVNREEASASSRIDDIAIEELARNNSVDKCLIWMEATKDDQRLGDDAACFVGENP